MSESAPGVVAAADRLRTAAVTRTACAPVRDLLPTGDIDAAYAVQELLTAEGVAAGRRVCGRKIGLTSRAVQRQLGVGQPDVGAVFGDTVHGDAEEIDVAGLLQPRVEPEIAFVLGSDLDLAHPTVADVLTATEYLLPAIEVVDSRIAGWDITIVDTVADNASSGAVVLGTTPRSADGFDFRLCGALIETGGDVVSVGAGAACLGSPVNAVRWLAGRLAERGTPLRAGDLVLSGALSPMVPAVATGAYEARIEGLGSVRALFGAGAAGAELAS